MSERERVWLWVAGGLLAAWAVSAVERGLAALDNGRYNLVRINEHGGTVIDTRTGRTHDDTTRAPASFQDEDFVRRAVKGVVDRLKEERAH